MTTSGEIVAVERSALAVLMPAILSRLSASWGAPVLGSAAAMENEVPLAGCPPTQPEESRGSDVALST